MSEAGAILLIDGDDEQRNKWKSYWEVEGYQVAAAGSGEEGIVQAEQMVPDLVLFDAELPDMDGFEVCRRIRASERCASVPVVLFTACSEPETELRSVAAGADDILSKDSHPLMMQARVRMILRLWKQAQPEVPAVTVDGEPLPAQHNGGMSLTGDKAGEKAEHFFARPVKLDEQRRIVTDLMDVDRQFASIFSFSSDAITIDSVEGGHYVDVNEAFLWTTGFTREEVIGKTALELNLWVEEDERKEAFRRMREDGYIRDLEILFRKKSGEIGYALVSASRFDLYGEMFQVVMARDISERKQAEIDRDRLNRELEKQNDELKVLHSISRLLSTQLSAEHIYQTMFEEVVSKLIRVDNFILASYHADEAEIRCVLAMVDGERADPSLFPAMPLGKGPISHTINTMKPHTADFSESADKLMEKKKLVVVGDNRMIRSGLYVPLISKDVVRGVMFVQSYQQDAFSDWDMSLLATLGGQLAVSLDNARLFEELSEERSSLEQRVQERTAELAVLNATLADALKHKDEFLANMSHELRTPLTAVMGRTELLLEGIYGPVSERQERSLKTIYTSAEHLLTLINEVLDLSKIQAGVLDLQIEREAVQPICEISLVMVKELAGRKRQQISFSQDPAVTHIECDKTRLKQMLVNLLSNAVKFTPERGQIGLKIEADEGAGRARFTVWDEGIGISQENLEKVFEPFVQVDSSLTRRQEGTGLGLALVSRLAELHGGTVSVESEVGVGSRFTISLPWQREKDDVW